MSTHISENDDRRKVEIGEPLKNLLRKALAMTALTLVTLCVNAQTPPVSTPTADVPDLGSVSGTTYTNNYFGLTLIVPAGWSVQDSNFKKQISDKGKELFTSDDPTKKSEINRAVDRTLNLLTVTERPPGEPGPFGMFISAAEKPPTGVKTDAGYMLALKNTLKYSQVPITIERDVYTEQIGGATFSVLDFKTDFSGVIVTQKYFAHIVKDYVLFFIITYTTPEQLQTETKVLKSIVLK
ncbi:MAG: hypothetical protein M3R68_05965 [Acidobacteriota bacterium]|nr:hypothetical protein [Acidobacteriota bacterium]